VVFDVSWTSNTTDVDVDGSFNSEDHTETGSHNTSETHLSTDSNDVEENHVLSHNDVQEVTPA